MPSYDVKSGDQSVLAAKITAAQTSGITIAAMNINGTSTAWANTAGVLEVTEQSDSTLKREWIYYTGTSVSATNVTTLTGVVRAIARDTTDVTSGGTGMAFSKGATVRFVTFHDLLNKKLNTDRDDTIDSGIKLQFASSANYIKGVGSDMTFKDGNNAATTLTQLTAAAGTDTKVRISAGDTTSGFLDGKLVAGAGITLTKGNPAGDETLTAAAVNTVATGHTGLSTVTTGGLLVGAGTSNMTIIGPGTSGQVPVSNGTTIAMGTAKAGTLVYSDSTDSSTITGSTSITTLKTITIPAGTVTTANSALIIDVPSTLALAAGDTQTASGTLTFSLSSQTAAITASVANAGSGTDTTNWQGFGTTRIIVHFTSVGASAAFKAYITSSGGPTQISSAATVNHSFGAITNATASGTADTTGALSILIRGTTAISSGTASLTVNGVFATHMPA